MTRPAGAWGVAAILVALVGTPLVWRVLLATAGPTSDRAPSYLPSLERARAREAFDTTLLGLLTDTPPGYVVIGDSMAGRVDPGRLEELSGQPVVSLAHFATGSATWYLTFKNVLVRSGVRPRVTFIFFRDDNLTDPMFRIEGAARPALDRVALDLEPELDAVVAQHLRLSWADRAHRVVDALYDLERTRAWIEPAFNAWPARLLAGDNAGALIDRANHAFDLSRLRPSTPADIPEASDTVATVDFHDAVRTSVLPLVLGLARERDLQLCFVRVLRRPPAPSVLPPESPGLQRYLTDLRRYLEARNAIYLDDRDDPALADLPYADGDHVAPEGNGAYTDRLWQRLQDRRP
jgi:hypothetical protein